MTGKPVVTPAGCEFLDPSGEVTPAADLICQPRVSSDAYVQALLRIPPNGLLISFPALAGSLRPIIHSLWNLPRERSHPMWVRKASGPAHDLCERPIPSLPESRARPA
jgi:hypothetical protein